MTVFGSKLRGDAREAMTLIGEDAFFHGTLAVKGSLRVEGVFEGNISDAVEVEVGARARILGDIAAETLIVAGEVIGNLVASRSIEFLSTARVSGDLRVPKLHIEDGAVFNGTCAMEGGSSKLRRGKSADVVASTAEAVS